MTAQHCFDAITQAAGRALSDDDLDRILTTIQNRMRRKAAMGGDPIAAAKAAAEEAANDARLAALIEKRNRAINVLRRQALDARVVEGEEARTVLRVLTGDQSGRAGAARSIDAVRHALSAQLFGPMIQELRKGGLLKVLTLRDKAFDRDVAREMWRMEDPTAGVPTRNRPAEAVAKILHNAQEVARAMQNDAGAWIGKADHYITRQSHDMDKIRGRGNEAAFEEWAAFIAPRLDERTFAHLNPEDPGALTKFLRSTWEALASGVHTTANGGDWLGGFKGPGNLAKKASQERVLHFKDADAWFDYNERFGRGAVVDSILHGLDHAARNTAVMRTLGTNPEALFGAWVDGLVTKARDRGDFAQVDKLRGRASILSPKAGTVLDIVTGKASIPENVSLAKIGQTVRNVQSLAKLGGVVLSSLPDVAVSVATLRWQGVPLLHGYAEMITSPLKGRRSGEAREIADLMAAGINGMLGEVVSRFSAVDGAPGKLSKMVEVFHRLNGLSYWTDSMKTGVALMLSSNLAKQSSREFAALPQKLQSSLRRYGIQEAEWEAIRRSAQKAADGRMHLTPDAVAALPDDAIAHLMGKEEASLRAAGLDGEALEAKLGKLRDRKRADLETSLRTYVADTVREAMNEPTARTRAAATWGTHPGTALGEAARLFNQFKTYPMTFLERTVGREFTRDGKDVAGIAHLIVATTLLGYVSMSLKEMAKGRNPRTPESVGDYRKIVMAAMQQGGGMGIYGDFLFGEANRIGGGFLATAAGPTFGNLDHLMTLMYAIRDGNDPRGKAIQLVKDNTPFINLFYTRAALDYLILYRLQEAVNPGYLRRYEQQVKKQNAQTFWLRPSEAVG